MLKMYRFGERLKAVRKQLNIQQQELAQRLGISYVTVSQWESGKRIPKGRTARRIAAALEIQVSELLNYYPCVTPILNAYEYAIAELNEMLKQYEMADVSEAPGAEYSYTYKIEAMTACKELLEDTVNSIVTQAIVNPTDDGMAFSNDKDGDNDTLQKEENTDYEKMLNSILKKMLLEIQETDIPNTQYQLIECISSSIFSALYKTMVCAKQEENADKSADESDIILLYRQLNPTGKQMLRHRLYELLEVPKYNYPVDENKE